MANCDRSADAGSAQRSDDDGADRGHEGVEQKRFAVRDRWRAFASLWREVARYDPPFHLDVSVGFICKQA